MEYESLPNDQTDKPKKAKQELKKIVDSLADQAIAKIESIFGPIRETSVPQAELDKLLNESSSLTHEQLARKCYELAQKYPADKTPEVFQQYLDQKTGTKKDK